MYCIVHRSKIFGKKYLAWQNPVWDDDGYFWTSKEVFKDIICNNTSEHPFLFASKNEAIAHLKSINIPQKCSVVRWTV